MKRKIDVAILSDTHLGTYGCHARELLNYLKNLDVNLLILNGDLFDIWQFKKNYFPAAHLQVINQILKKAIHGTKVYYLTGNHDEMMRRFDQVDLGNLSIRDQLELHLAGKKYWIFHGDVFDASVLISPWLAKMGGWGYDYLIRINRLINKVREKFHLSKLSFAHQVKHSVKKAVKFIQDFEKIAIQSGLDKGFDYVVCGHIHQPSVKKVSVEDKTIIYMNSGDWIENLTALEFYGGEWHLYRYDELDFEFLEQDEKIKNNLAEMLGSSLGQLQAPSQPTGESSFLVVDDLTEDKTFEPKQPLTQPTSSTH